MAEMTLPPLDTPIAHNGSPECPVHGETIVSVKYRAGSRNDARVSGIAGGRNWPDVITFTIIARAPGDRIAELEAENARLKAFIADFAEAKFEALRRPYCPDPQDEEDPVTEALTVWAWQEDSRATLKGKTDV